MKMGSSKDGQVPVVLLGVGLPALEVARSLGRRGVEVIGVDWRAGWVSRSRYLTRTLCPASESEEELRRVLDRLAGELPGRPLLMPLHDDYVLFLSRHREALGRHYRFLMPDPGLIEALVSKRGLWSVCQDTGVPLPATHFPGSAGDLPALAARLTYPCIIKPSLSSDWDRTRPPMVEGPQKVVEVHSPAQLLEMKPLLAGEYGEVVIQEVIPGPDSNLYYLAAYFDRRGEPLASFVGRKLRTAPPHFGAGTYVESVCAPEVARLGLGLLKQLGYKGCGGVEFKLDPRDGLFKLIEINARFGLWDGFAAACGLDIARLAYADAVGLPLPSCDGYRAGRRWVQLDRDFWAALQYKRDGQITLARWLASLLRCRVFAPAALDDPMPWFALNLVFGRTLLGSAGRRVLTALARGRRAPPGTAACACESQAQQP
jgi:predicted ATP-grasp superfamily ATP-dependent carboligase